jgi:hypothetical protein
LGISGCANQDLSYLIPFLASKFDKDQFKRMQITSLIDLSKVHETFSQRDLGELEKFKNSIPKQFLIDARYCGEDQIKPEWLNLFDPATFSFYYIFYAGSELPRDFELLKVASNKTKKIWISIDNELDVENPSYIINNNSITDSFKISNKIKYNNLMNILNIFNNIKILDFSMKKVEF